MIPVPSIPEPALFRDEVQTPGEAWLTNHPQPTEEEPPKLWLTGGGGSHRRTLRDGFSNRCGFTAHLIDHGSVDHFLSQKNHRERTYRWDNLRWVASWINSAKKPAHDGFLLDPFLVGNDWFEVDLASMELRLVENLIPAAFLEKAKFTLRKLPIRDDERVVNYRESCYAEFKAAPNDTALHWLRREAPLVAAAVEKWMREHPGEPFP